jgi:predicted MPP superfamily phosphohydrolase
VAYLQRVEPYELAYNALVLALALASLRAFARRASGRWGLAALGLVVTVLAAPMVALPARGNYFAALRLLAWAVFAQGPLFLAALAVLLGRRSGRLAVVPALLAAALVGVAVDAFLVEPRALDLRRVRIPSRKVSSPLRIALVSDLQTDTPGERELGALRRVQAERPDLVLFSGDYIQQQTPEAVHRDQATLRAMVLRARVGARLGAFAVEGNTEWPTLWPALWEGTGVRALTASQRVDLGELVLTAFTLRDSFSDTLRVPPEARFHVALGHAPDFALGAVEADLLVAGHTHGGQVRLPWVGPLMTLSRVPRAWASGTTALSRGRTLVVSQGVGMERHDAPRLRFRCRPELVLIDVVPAS